ncbi:hypothetical protein OGAPHI_004357 [Ogataea philodendri]|uniref:Uncharacterized protein n=1 Tax=Ogataea philodendri TaxID=1378263 RepID=A0A9P8T4P2_9ASCO|nr:uncharacterized protein OGAPHI_004357 [Ogataea philodendri]KAH3666168.1 hypothetical protein OGAPHI_004357 [Ogataea philodendri]
MNCVKANRECDYSIKLIWGGRPYKKPRTEKLNPVAGLSRKILEQEPKPLEQKKRFKKIAFQTAKPIPEIKTEEPETFSISLEEPGFVGKPIPQADNIHENIQTVSNVLDSMYDMPTKPSQILEDFSSYIPEPMPSGLDLTDLADEYSEDLLKLEASQPATQSNLTAIPFLNERRRSPRWSKWDDLDDESDQLTSRELSNFSVHSQTNSESSASETIEMIPRGILPLPDLLLNVPTYYESFQFFFSSTTQLFMPFGNNTELYNPFTSVLPQLAFANDGLLSVTIAYGLAHKSYLASQEEPTETLEQLLSRSLGELLQLLQNKDTSTSDLTLTLVLLISSFMVFTFKRNWEVHWKGAKQILLLRGYKKPFDKLLKDSQRVEASQIDSEIKKSKLIFFLLRWFAYLDVLSNLSSPIEPSAQEYEEFANQQNIPKNDRYLSADIDYEFETTSYSESLMLDESRCNVDYFLGFNIKYLSLYKKTIQLIKETNMREKLEPGSRISSQVVDRALQEVLRFQELSRKVTAGEDPTIAFDRVFALLGLNQIYRRVLKIPKSSPLIQDMCNETIQVINAYLLDDAPNQISVFLPIFVSGCDSQDESIRAQYLERMKKIAFTGSLSAKVAMVFMEKCWSEDLDWWHVMEKEEKKYIFF